MIGSYKLIAKSIVVWYNKIMSDYVIKLEIKINAYG